MTSTAAATGLATPLIPRVGRTRRGDDTLTQERSQRTSRWRSPLVAGAILASPLLLVALVVSVLRGPIPYQDPVNGVATFAIDGSGISLNILMASHRKQGGVRVRPSLELRSHGELLLAEAMQERWRREVRMNLYEKDGYLLIRDCVYGTHVYLVDLERHTLAIQKGALPASWTDWRSTNPVGLRFLGAFDVDDKGTWRFIPASERPALELPEPER